MKSIMMIEFIGLVHVNPLNGRQNQGKGSVADWLTSNLCLQRRTSRHRSGKKASIHLSSYTHLSDSPRDHSRPDYPRARSCVEFYPTPQWHESIIRNNQLALNIHGNDLVHWPGTTYEPAVDQCHTVGWRQKGSLNRRYSGPHSGTEAISLIVAAQCS